MLLKMSCIEPAGLPGERWDGVGGGGGDCGSGDVGGGDCGSGDVCEHDVI